MLLSEGDLINCFFITELSRMSELSRRIVGNSYLIPQYEEQVAFSRLWLALQNDQFSFSLRKCDSGLNL